MERPIPYAVRRIVGECHVGHTNREVVEEVLSRTKKGAWERLPALARITTLRQIIFAHAENRRLYGAVMGPGYTELADIEGEIHRTFGGRLP